MGKKTLENRLYVVSMRISRDDRQLPVWMVVRSRKLIPVGKLDGEVWKQVKNLWAKYVSKTLPEYAIAYTKKNILFCTRETGVPTSCVARDAPELDRYAKNVAEVLRTYSFVDTVREIQEWQLETEIGRLKLIEEL